VWNLGNELGVIIVQQADNSITVTGWNNTGALGIGSNTTPTVPTNAPLWLGGDSSMVIQSVHMGGKLVTSSASLNVSNIYMFLDNGTTSRLAGSGSGDFGSFGRGSNVSTNVPVTPLTSTGLTGRVSKVMTSGSAAMTVYVKMANGNLFSWGYNNQGQVGDSNPTNFGVWTPYLLTTDVIDLIGGIESWDYQGQLTPAPIVKKAFGYYCCGYGASGIGDGYQDSTNSSLRLIQFPNGTNLKLIGTYGNDEGLTRFAVTTDNKIFVWGYNGISGIDPGSNNNWNYLVPIQFIPPLLRK